MKQIKKKLRNKGMRVLLSVLLSIGLAGSSFQVAATENVTEEAAVADLDTLSAPENVNKKGYDVVYVVDNSRSVWSQQAIRNNALRNISSMAVWSDIRIGGVFFADQVYDTLSLTSVKDDGGVDKVLKFLNMTEQDPNNIDTNIGNALEAALKLFDSQNASRERIVVLFSDGINERLDGNSDYARDANTKTEEQVKILKDNNIPIYCVFLQKDRNDEGYLKNLVNYFSDENSYTEERFFAVPEENIAYLSDAFVDVFHSMQNHMKYRQISLDSEGTMKFYIPSLGISQLKIYQDGNLAQAKINPPTEKEGKERKVGTASYTLYEDPEVGEWSMEVPSKLVTGTITCYADLFAKAEMRTVQDGGDGKQYRLVVSFYDKNGKEISIDPMVSMDGKVFFAPEGGVEHPIEMSMMVENGKGVSEPFALDTYGSYRFEVHVEYEDFVNLDYALEGGKIKKQAPVVYDKWNQVFSSEKTEKGYVFTLEESQLFKDPEGDAVTIEKVVQLVDGNPVSVEYTDGYVKFTTPKSGDFHCVLQLKDASGMETEMTVQGTVKDRKVIMLMDILLKAALAVVALLIIWLFFNKMKKKAKLREEIKLFHESKADFAKAVNIMDKAAAEIPELEEAFQGLLDGNEEMDMTGLKELAEGMSDELAAVYGVEKYLNPNFVEDTMEPAKELSNNTTDWEAKVEKFSEQIGGMENSKVSINLKIERVKTMKDAVDDFAEKTIENSKELEAFTKDAVASLEEMNNTIIHMMDLMDGEIQCNLSVTDIQNKRYVRGYRGFRQIGGTAMRCYPLDEVSVLGGTTLADEIGETGIYVFSHIAEDGSHGLELRSANGFHVEGVELEKFGERGVCAVLKSGKGYIVKTARGINMTLTVEG